MDWRNEEARSKMSHSTFLARAPVLATTQFCADYLQRERASGVIWLGLSGGLDSRVLLHLLNLVRAVLPIQLNAIHVNHRLSPHADAWSEQCASLCAQYHISYHLHHVDLSQVTGGSLEAVAREKRYRIFAQLLQAGDLLLTAHQQDDQAETFLLQLLRGAGVKGLAAMPVMKNFAQGFHGRPLLNVSRAVLEEYAQAEKLAWIEDESNEYRHFQRNYLRHEVLPVLRKKWPAVSETIARSAAHCAQAQMLLQEYAVSIMSKIKGSKEGTLSVSGLLSYDLPQQQLIIRTWIQQQGFSLPNEKKLMAICHDVLHAARDRMPCVYFGEAEVKCYQDDLYVMKKNRRMDASLRWHDRDVDAGADIDADSRVDINASSGAEIDTGLRSDIPDVTVKFRQGGEIIFIAGRGHRALKLMWQEWRVPPWERARIPLLFVGEECVAVVGYFVDSRYAAAIGESGLKMKLLF